MTPRVKLLWVLAGAAALAVAAVLACASVLSGPRPGAAEAVAAKGTIGSVQQPPTMFGTITSFDGTAIKVDSKQPYDEVLIDSDTTISTVGGSTAPPASIKPGAVMTATGKDLGDRRMDAAAVVILENR